MNQSLAMRMPRRDGDYLAKYPPGLDMDFELRQRGGAAIDFIGGMGMGMGMGMAIGPVSARVNAAISAAGLGRDEALAEDLDMRQQQFERALGPLCAFRVGNLLCDFYADEHGRACRLAWEEVAESVQSTLPSADDGPTTLTLDPTLDPTLELPDYWCTVDFHRTRGGWEGHPDMDMIHGELIHKRLVNRAYGGDIFAQRRRVLDELPRKDYARVLELGTSTAHFTTQLQAAYPNADVHGCDIIATPLKHARRGGNLGGHRWQLLQACAETTGRPAASYDLVASYILLYELPAEIIRAVFREAFRVLAPGAIC